MRGLYLHIPFCRKKCPYCDFYSLPGNEALYDEYTAALILRLKGYDECFDTVYFGGGTPSILGAERLCRILSAINTTSANTAEITLEANPTDLPPEFFPALYSGGFNRLSMGLQSNSPTELAALGRRHSPEDAAKAVKQAQSAGFNNISLDLMLGVPGQSLKSLMESISFCASLKIQHISCYILKLEEGTEFYKKRDSLKLSDEDEQCSLYLSMAEKLEALGFPQYEISNFSRKGFESRHNLKYWRCEEYLGLGPGAHSFYNGMRSYFPRDIGYFINGGPPVDDGPGGDPQEELMLRLRLSEGIGEACCSRLPGGFGGLLERSKAIPKEYLRLSTHKLALSPKGFLLSNAIIAKLMP